MLLIGKAIDHTGKTYGRLFVKQFLGRNNQRATLWLCQCSCGNVITVRGSALSSHHTSSCGCLQKEFVANMAKARYEVHRNSMIGMVFGRLTVVNYFEALYQKDPDGYNLVWYMCHCDCGNITDVLGTSLLNGDTTSCGCFNKQITSLRSTIHGMSKHRLASILNGMIQRCHNEKNPNFDNYGGREENPITVCDEWRNNKESFYQWALLNGYEDNLTIERIDDNKGYRLNNCRWITHSEQARNKRNNKLTMQKSQSIRNDHRTIREIALEYNISETNVYDVKSNRIWKE